MYYVTCMYMYIRSTSLIQLLFREMLPYIPRNRLTVSMLQQEPVLILHFSVVRCIVSIMANTSLVSETLLTKRAILSDAYTCTCKY